MVIQAESLLSADNIRRLLVEMPVTFTSFHPLGYVLIVMLGAGVAERSGLLGSAMSAAVSNVPKLLLTPAVALVGGASRAVELADPEFRLEALPELGSTFDGRDVFAPAAAHLCCGVPISALGPPIDPATLTPGMLPVSSREGDDLVAEVLWVDRFGNCQLNLDPASLDDLAPAGAPLQVAAGEDLRTAERVAAYADVSPGRVGLITDSSGLVSLAVPRRSAADDLGLHEGAEVRIAAAAGGGADGAAATATPVGLGRRPAGPAGNDIGGRT